MDKILLKKKMIFFTINILLVIFSVFFQVCFYKGIGIAGVVLSGFLFISMLILISYYFNRYINTVKFIEEASTKAKSGIFDFYVLDCSEEQKVLIDQFKDIEKELLKIQNMFETGKLTNEKEFEGIYRKIILKYNSSLKNADAALKVKENEIEELNNQVRLILNGVENRSTLNLRGMKGETYKLGETIDKMQKINRKVFDDLNVFAKSLTQGKEWQMPVSDELPSEVIELYSNFNLYLKTSAERAKEIVDTLYSIEKGETSVNLKKNYSGYYLNVKVGLQKIAKEYSKNERNSKQEKIDNMKPYSGIKKEIARTSDKQRKNSINLLTPSLPKAPKIKENFDHIFESENYGKYSV